MNPPSALQGAMGRERKPFTYTPGGLDLSEIKSERMAKRLMRNAMNQGVPEQPPQIQSPTAPTTPIAVPNFNCLPVQVFPAFNLPANPKSLLRTRSTPDQPREPLKAPPPQNNTNSVKPSTGDFGRDAISNNVPLSAQINNTRPAPTFEYNAVPANNNATKNNYGSTKHTNPVLPKISYEAEYFTTTLKNNAPENVEPAYQITNQRYQNDANIKPDINAMSEPVDLDFTIKPLSETLFRPTIETKPVEEVVGTDGDDDDDDDNDEQREVKIVKKVKKEKKVESQNGADQNGDAETELVVKLPTKKSAAKTETKVEVTSKTLPDGSIEETKNTTTRTTIDGKTEIKTKTETTIIPKQDDDEEEEYEEEVEDNGEVEIHEVEEKTEPTTVVIKKTVKEAPAVKETSKVVKREEKSETTTTKKVVVVQKSGEKQQETEEEQEEEEEEEVVESEPVIVQKPAEPKPEPPKQDTKKEVKEVKAVVEKQTEEKVEKVVVKEQEEEEEEEDEEEEEEVKEVKKVDVKPEPAKEEPKLKEEEEEEVEEEEEYEEAEEPEPKPEPKAEKPAEPVKESKEEDEESEYTEEEIESDKEEAASAEQPKPVPKEEHAKEEPKPEEKKEEKPEPAAVPEQKVPLREPSVPLEKVEDVEIKPIGLTTESVSKSHTQSTEILKNASEQPSNIHSTQTEYNRFENIVTVNRTTKTLDHSYEQITQQGVPTVKTYFAPDRERVSISPSRPYQPVYAPTQSQQPPERRHSLLLERLSTERQMPSELYQSQNYQHNNQSYDQRQWSQEPQSEVINVSNVKPSKITNQQWYQQSRKENVLYNNVLPSQQQPPAPAQPWSQPQQQPVYPSYTEDTSRLSSSTYQQQTNFTPTYAPQPTNWASNNASSLSNTNSQSLNQYSYLNKDSSENYQKSTQQYSSSYVPPPWEQDSTYVAPELPKQNYYQQPGAANTFSPSATPAWKPAAGKAPKPAPTSYIPPAPNQSFVRSVIAEPPRQPGRKTYYSEYERRYITVPESTYIPTDTKFQPQPDPSPQYYYDNNEPNEAVEHEWRKELREFTEKTSQTQTQTQTQTQSQQHLEHSTQSSMRPPWESEPQYAKIPNVTYTPTPSWSQTLRPQNCRERSFESEYIGAKTNTLGRGRPLSSYGNTNVEATIPERSRGVSVDRYNPNNYQSPIPAEHGPVQTHTHIPIPTGQAKAYHNAGVPGYHARASAEPRDHPVPIPTARQWGTDPRTTPIQSRSFKYLQWITGTED